jgi:hypothetical protein
MHNLGARTGRRKGRVQRHRGEEGKEGEKK